MSNYLINYDSSLIPLTDVFEPYSYGSLAPPTYYYDNNNSDLNTLFSPYIPDTSMAIQTNYYVNQSAIKKDLNEIFQPIVVFPVGNIMIWPSNTPPQNYLMADGSSYSISAYPQLYSAIGTTYGGSGSNFNVPNMNQSAMPYYDTNTNINYGSFSGSANLSLNVNQLPTHTHSGTNASISHTHLAYPSSTNFTIQGTTTGGTSVSPYANYVVNLNSVPFPSSTGNNSDSAFTLTNGQTGGTTNSTQNSINIQNPYIVINYVIKYQ